MEGLLPIIWLAIIGFLLLFYALTDGFDLGVGIISLMTRGQEDRGLMMDSISGIWHLNQTWLVVLGGMLFGAFPLFYGILFSALYLPSMVMLLGFVFRGVAFDFREHSERPGTWEFLFGLGSLIATLAQGLALGGLLSGVRLSQNRFIGSVWDWWNPFTALVTLGVFLGYVMLGAHYLILKTEGALQERSRCYRPLFLPGHPVRFRRCIPVAHPPPSPHGPQVVHGAGLVYGGPVSPPGGRGLHDAFLQPG